jgi:hypothetical protein
MKQLRGNQGASISKNIARPYFQQLQLDEEQRIDDIKQGRDDAISGKPLAEQSYDYYTGYTQSYLTAALNLLGGKDEPI